MAQYQTFPGSDGASQSLGKLVSLSLPQMRGKSFLDVGCNEGFFCGYAKYFGAERSVGIDMSAEFIGRARNRFPDCEFHQQSWDSLPEGKFDVILLASALHYADDQEALLHRLVDCLTPDGILILEVGVVRQPGSAWVKVTRGIDERYFATMRKWTEMLDNYAWRNLGPSVSQAGDPSPRYVFHVSKLQPTAYLLTSPGASGKSTISRTLFKPAGVRVISGDALIISMARKEIWTPPPLEAILSPDLSVLKIDEALDAIAKAGLIERYAKFVCRKAESKDFCYDGYIPPKYQQTFLNAVRAAGYLAVTLAWDPLREPPMPKNRSTALAEEYYGALGAKVDRKPSKSAFRPQGFVDRIVQEGGEKGDQLVGWAFDASGEAVNQLRIKLGKTERVTEFDAEWRPDVKSHFDLPGSGIGFRVTLQGEEAANLSSLEVSAKGADGMWFGPLRHSREIRR